MPRKWMEKEAGKTKQAMGGRVKRDVEKVRQIRRTTAKDRSWRLLKENDFFRKIETQRRRKRRCTVTMADLTLPTGCQQENNQLS